MVSFFSLVPFVVSARYHIHQVLSLPQHIHPIVESVELYIFPFLHFLVGAAIDIYRFIEVPHLRVLELLDLEPDLGMVQHHRSQGAFITACSCCLRAADECHWAAMSWACYGWNGWKPATLLYSLNVNMFGQYMMYKLQNG